jgi:hypothetical protein
MMTLWDRRGGRKALVESEVCDRGNQPNQSVGDKGADRANRQRHRGQQQHTAVGAEIRQCICGGFERCGRLAVSHWRKYRFCLH